MVTKHEHEQVRIYLGYVDAHTLDARLASNLVVFVDREQRHEKYINEADEGPHGFVVYTATDDEGNLVPGPVNRTITGRVHFELKANSGLTASQIKELQHPDNNADLDKKPLEPLKNSDWFKTKPRRISRPTVRL